MSEKHDLAVLCSLLDRPIAEFVESEPFKKLEQETDVIRHIEPFGLPEIKRLICCSELLAIQEWAEKYTEARKLYANGMDFDVLSLLLKYNDVRDFEKKILACVDESILERINAYFKKIETEKEQAKKERSSLKGKITKAKKKLAEETSQEVSAEELNTAVIDGGEVDADDNPTLEMVAPQTKSDDEIRVEKLSQIISEREKFLKIYTKHASRTEAFLYQMKNIEAINAQRQKAYKAIDEIKPPVEEEFLCHYIQSGKLSAEEEKSLRNYGFLQRFIELFDKVSYWNLAFPVLARLYSDNAIDLESDLIAKFIGTHGGLLAEYLKVKYSEVPDYLEDTENRVFLEYSIKGTVAGSNEYAEWWNSISRAADWRIVLETAEEIIDDSVLKVAVKLMHHVNGSSMDAFMELLQSEQSEAFRITPAEFIIEFVGQEAPEQRDLVRGYIRRADQNVRKLQRRVAIKEREINRHTQELFSALYQPLEQLEQLAVNLRLSDGEIKCSLVAGHVINALADLRESLSALGLDTVDEVEAWRKQSFVEYDPEKHRMPSTIGSVGEQVKLQTLGFAYTDDEGNKKIRAAEVYIPVPVEEQPEKVSGIKVSEQNHQNHISDTTHTKKKKGYPKNGSVVKKPKKFTQSQKGKKK